MVEDRENLPQRDGRDPGDCRRRTIVSPEPRCESHRRGRCDCEDDGSGAGELMPEDEAR